MSSTPLPLLLLLVPCCTARLPPEPVSAAADELSASTYPGPLDPRGGDSVLAVCDGTVNVPIPCIRFWIDKGDPPPDDPSRELPSGK